MPNSYSDDNVTFESDKLYRKIYADSIISLIENANDTLTENKSFVIALDSAWGTGKSVFIRMLKNKINQEKENIVPIIYNAWEYDHCENAFQPLIYSIIQDDIFSAAIRKENGKHLWKTIPKIIKAFSKDIAGRIGVENTFEACCESCSSFKDYIMKSTASFAELDEQKKAFDDFKECLYKTISWLQKENNRLLIIVDELDRCRPLFAIETLEVIKHLFDIPNIVFLLSVDFSQLRHSIATVYGQNMDSDGYLRRFVNYVLKLPEPSKNEYVDYLIESYPFLKKLNYPDGRDAFFADIKTVLNFESLSLRDINTIYENFRMFYLSYFSDNPDQILSLPYLIMILFKYKTPEIYELIKNKRFQEAFDKYMGNRYKTSFIAIAGLQNEMFSMVFDRTDPMDKQKCEIKEIESLNVSVNGSIHDRFERVNNRVYTNDNREEFYTYSDLIKLREMSDPNLTHAQFIAKQIEMFTYNQTLFVEKENAPLLQ